MMNKLIFGAATFGLALSSVGRADEPRSIGAQNLFIPNGYDDNDEIIAVADGFLPSTCYQLANPVVTTDVAKHTVTVDLKAHVQSGTCINVPVPFQQEVELGSLPAGEWNVKTTVSGLTAALPVKVATTASSDDYLYAPIDSTEVTFDPRQDRWSVKLVGDILASCLSLQEVRVLDQGGVLVVLPIMEQIDEECRPSVSHFERKVLLPASIQPGRHLLHVRSLNGRGVNTLFDVQP